MGLVEIQQKAQPLGLTRLALQFPVADSQLIKFRAQTQVLGPGAAEADVLRPNASRFGKSPGAAAFKRHHRRSGPVTDQPDVMVALDLESEQQDLSQHEGGQQSQRTLTKSAVEHR